MFGLLLVLLLLLLLQLLLVEIPTVVADLWRSVCPGGLLEERVIVRRCGRFNEEIGCSSLVGWLPINY